MPVEVADRIWAKSGVEPAPPFTTPACSPESTGLAEAFVHALQRDYVNSTALRDVEMVLAQLSGWLENYNRQPSQSALGMRPPTECRAPLKLTPPSVSGFGEQTTSTAALRLCQPPHFFPPLLKLAVTDTAAFTVTVQSPVPVQPPPVQPLKWAPRPGTAVRVTTEPLA